MGGETDRRQTHRADLAMERFVEIMEDAETALPVCGAGDGCQESRGGHGCYVLPLLLLAASGSWVARVEINTQALIKPAPATRLSRREKQTAARINCTGVLHLLHLVDRSTQVRLAGY